MTLEELQTELNGLIHQTCTFKRIAGNSIIIYFFGEPGDDSVIGVFVDPSWRYQKNGKIILGSYDLQIKVGLLVREVLMIRPSLGAIAITLLALQSEARGFIMRQSKSQEAQDASKVKPGILASYLKPVQKSGSAPWVRAASSAQSRHEAD